VHSFENCIETNRLAFTNHILTYILPFWPKLWGGHFLFADVAWTSPAVVKHHVSSGDLLFSPAKVFRDIQVISERIKLLVIYAPPSGEAPEKVIKRANPKGT
jgi:hypothetical protein